MKVLLFTIIAFAMMTTIAVTWELVDDYALSHNLKWTTHGAFVKYFTILVYIHLVLLFAFKYFKLI